jgi:hypothetical protein
MKRKLRIGLLGLFCSIMVYGCNQKRDAKQERLEAKDVQEGESDSLKNSADKDLETAKHCPIEILSTEVVYTTDNIPQARIMVFNHAEKAIDEVKVGIYCYNNLDEPVTDRLGGNYFSGASQSLINPKETGSFLWELYTDGVTKVKPFVREIHFVDGSTWTYETYLKK